MANNTAKFCTTITTIANNLAQSDMIFVKTFTRPEFSGPTFYTKMHNSENLRQDSMHLHSVCKGLHSMCKVYTILFKLN